MRQKLLISFGAVIVALMVLVAGAGAQPVSLQDQLAAQYKLAKMESDTSGYSVVEVCSGCPICDLKMFEHAARKRHDWTVAFQ